MHLRFVEFWIVCIVINSVEYKDMILLIWIWFNYFIEDVCDLFHETLFSCSAKYEMSKLCFKYEKICFASWNSLEKEKASWIEYCNSNYAIKYVFSPNCLRLYPHVSLGDMSKGVYLLTPFMLSVSFTTSLARSTFNFTFNSACFHFSWMYSNRLFWTGCHSLPCISLWSILHLLWLWTLKGCGMYRRLGLIAYSW